MAYTVMAYGVTAYVSLVHTVMAQDDGHGADAEKEVELPHPSFILCVRRIEKRFCSTCFTGRTSVASKPCPRLVHGQHREPSSSRRGGSSAFQGSYALLHQACHAMCTASPAWVRRRPGKSKKWRLMIHNNCNNHKYHNNHNDRNIDNNHKIIKNHY